MGSTPSLKPLMEQDGKVVTAINVAYFQTAESWKAVNGTKRLNDALMTVRVK